MIFALSAIFCFSIVYGNTSLCYLPVSFNQAIGATTPFFTEIFVFLITCKKETGEVYLTLLSVVFSIIVASNSEAEKTSLPFSLWRDGDSRGLGSNVKVVAIISIMLNI